jgi:17beta-estradiol 17-dehydrogenase / very-long-chain 3-oxoacyl-CoA reductase
MFDFANNVWSSMQNASDDKLVQLVITIIAVLGARALFKYIKEAIGFAMFFFRSASLSKYGTWAVITGATDGIGFAYAKELAKRGLNIVLISRTQSKLDACKKEIETKYPKVEVRTIAADFTKTDGLFDHIKKELSDVPVGILINNVGLSYPHAEFLHLTTDEQVQGLIDVNIWGTTEMTRMVLPGMLERKTGAIINIASAAGLLYTGDPLYELYSATKGYVDMLSRSMNLSYAKKGIDVQCQVPWFVTTKLAKIRHSSLTVPTPEQWARAAAAQIGYGASVVPYPVHRIVHFLAQRALPEFLFKKLLLDHHFGIRKRAYKKKERLAKEGKDQ